MAQSAWTATASVGTYKHCLPSVTPLHPQHHVWQQLEASAALQPSTMDPAAPLRGVFEQVPAGQPLCRDRAHVLITSSAITADSSIPQLLHDAQRLASSGFADSGMSAIQLNVVDAMYKLEPAACEQLNACLEDSEFGPFDYISDAVTKLLQLRRQRRKADKAAALERLLADFAAQRGGCLDDLLQWPLLLKMKKIRDAFAFEGSLRQVGVPEVLESPVGRP